MAAQVDANRGVAADCRPLRSQPLGYGWLWRFAPTIGFVVSSVRAHATYPCFTATLTGYAYETIANNAIIAGKTKGPDDAEPTASDTHTPEPVMLGALALGAPGLFIWRREESVAAFVVAEMASHSPHDSQSFQFSSSAAQHVCACG